MTNQSAPEPIKKGKGASSNPVPVSYLSHATHVKNAARSAEKDISYLNSAFLAERGCLSPENPHQHTAA